MTLKKVMNHCSRIPKRKGPKYCELKCEKEKNHYQHYFKTHRESVSEGMYSLQKGLESQTVLHLQVRF